MQTTVTILTFLGILALLVAGHELGHFLVAKAVGIRVEEFAVGFGNKLWSHRRGETLYSLRMIPLGGFNRFAGMEVSTDRPPEPGDFQAQGPLARLAVILAGSTMNLLIGAVLFALVYGPVGLPVPHPEAVIGQTLAGYPAAAAGLRAGDRVLSIDHRAVDSWAGLVKQLAASGRGTLAIEVARGSRRFSVEMRSTVDPASGRHLIGISPLVTTAHQSLPGALRSGFRQAGQFVTMWFATIYQAIRQDHAPQVAGPVGIGAMVGQATQQGLADVLLLTGFLSVQLGIINLLPIPALDGSRAVFIGLEGLRLKLNPAREEFIHLVGFILLMFLMILVTFHDLLRLGVG